MKANKKILLTAGIPILIALSLSVGVYASAAVKNDTFGGSYINRAADGVAGYVDMQICTNTLVVYGNDNLIGAQIAIFQRGDIISVKYYAPGVYVVYGNGGIMGYCSSVDIAASSSVVYTVCPYAYEVDELGTVKVSDMVDLELYLYENDSLLLSAGSDAVLLQQSTLKKLEAAAEALPAHYSIRILSGYAPEVMEEENTDLSTEGEPSGDSQTDTAVSIPTGDSQTDTAVSLPTGTGGVVCVKLYYYGVEALFSDLPGFNSIMVKAGFETTDIEGCYIDNGIDTFMSVSYEIADLPRFALN